MKKLLLLIAVVTIAMVSFNSCKKCKGEDPRARIVNNGTKTADVQIKTSGGNTVNINGVGAGTTSEYKSYEAGDVTFTISVDKNNYVKVVSMSECFEYDISIDASNNVVSTPHDRNE